MPHDTIAAIASELKNRVPWRVEIETKAIRGARDGKGAHDGIVYVFLGAPERLRGVRAELGEAGGGLDAALAAVPKPARAAGRLGASDIRTAACLADLRYGSRTLIKGLVLGDVDEVVIGSTIYNGGAYDESKFAVEAHRRGDAATHLDAIVVVVEPTLNDLEKRMLARVQHTEANFLESVRLWGDLAADHANVRDAARDAAAIADDVRLELATHQTANEFAALVGHHHGHGHGEGPGGGQGDDADAQHERQEQAHEARDEAMEAAAEMRQEHFEEMRAEREAGGGRGLDGIRGGAKLDPNLSARALLLKRIGVLIARGNK